MKPLTLAVLGILLSLTSPALAQKSKKDWRVDPYTLNDSEARKKAGYVTFDPKAWGDGHGPRAIRQQLGDIQMLWVETAHFRIASSLPAYSLSNDRKERDKIRKELAQLEQRLPNLVAKKVRKLDPWLRLHLIAMRLENFYQEFQDRLGVSDQDFPTKAGTLVNNRYMGQGPYLGQQEKFTVMITAKASTMVRYTSTFCGWSLEVPKRHNFVRTGSLFFGTSIEFSDGAMKKDTALHCHLIFNVSHNILNAYRYYGHEIPLWYTEGMAHWFARNVSPEYNDFSQVEEYGADTRATWNWPPKVYGRAKFEVYPASSKVFRWDNFDDMKFTDHMIIWSRCDYLMSLGNEKFAAFMNRMKDPIRTDGTLPTAAEVFTRHDEAFQAAWKLTPEEFDTQWREWVLGHYPKK
ncbi:MAG: hypothetical protein DWQ01_04530 [Planctomycetota bacterium]|nr:MAG: hypothetical protein DWQ01_04530 [Planctomycetota bacterium]